MIFLCHVFDVNQNEAIITLLVSLFVWYEKIYAENVEEIAILFSLQNGEYFRCF